MVIGFAPAHFLTQTMAANPNDHRKGRFIAPTADLSALLTDVKGAFSYGTWH
jgi:hypothetical protein